MPMVEMTLDTLKDLEDGRVSVAFAHELKRAVLDCIDRPGDKNARKVSLEFAISPIIDQDTGQCEGANGEFEIKSKVPTRKSKTYQFNVTKQGQLSYSANNPQNRLQHTIEDMDESGRCE